MSVYPFDSQKCSIVFITKGNSDSFIELIKDKRNYSGPIDLTQYFVKRHSYEYINITGVGVPGISFQIVLGRRILSQILTTYLPTILICIICFSTNYFKAFFFEAIVTVNLTALLVLATMFISVSNR